MNRAQNMLLAVSWLTVASAGFVAGQSPAATQRRAPTEGVRTTRTQAAAQLGGCASNPLPDPAPATRQPPTTPETCPKCDAVDGAVPPRQIPSVQPGRGTLQGAHDAALRSIQILTKADNTWADRYLAAESQNPMGKTIEGRLYLRLDAIEKIAASQHP